MQHIILYSVLFIFIMLSFLRGKHILFNIILTAYPTSIIYKAVLEYMGSDFMKKGIMGLSYFNSHLSLFILILIPVYISMIRIMREFRLHHNLKGVFESIILSIGIVLMTIGICFHILPDNDIFDLNKPFEVFFQKNIGYLICMSIPMLSVFLLSKKSQDLQE